MTLTSKLPSYTFYGGNVVLVLVNFVFSLPLTFTLVAVSISHFLTAVTNFSCCSSNKKYLLCFLFVFFFHLSLELCVSLFLVELRRPVAFITFSFPCLSLSLYSKFVDMTINLSSILKTTRIQKQFPLAVFVFIDSLVVSASQDGSGYAISRQNNLEFHLG